jgi:hypothetical protein
VLPSAQKPVLLGGHLQVSLKGIKEMKPLAQKKLIN